MPATPTWSRAKTSAAPVPRSASDGSRSVPPAAASSGPCAAAPIVRACRSPVVQLGASRSPSQAVCDHTAHQRPSRATTDPVSPELSVVSSTRTALGRPPCGTLATAKTLAIGSAVEPARSTNVVRPSSATSSTR